MFVGGIDSRVTQKQLGEYFKHFAPVISVKLVGFHENKSRGFAFVEFLSETQMKQVSKIRHEIYGKILDCKPSVTQGQQENLQIQLSQQQRKVFAF